MLKYCIYVLLIYCSVELSAQCSFERYYPYHPLGNIFRFKSIELSDGGYLLAGVAHLDSMDVVDGTQPNMVLIKTDACGKTLWVNDAGYIEDGDPAVYLIETDDHHYVMASNNGFSGVRIGKYNTKGVLIKESWITVGNNRVSDVMGLLKRTGTANRFVVYGSNYSVGGQNSVPYIVEIDADLNTKRSHEYYYENEFSPKIFTAATLGFLFTKDSLSYRGILSYENGTTREHTVVLVELDTTFLIKQFVFICEDSLTEYGWYEDGLVLSADGQTLTGGGRIKYKNEPWPEYKDAIIRIDIEGNIQKVVYLADSISFTTNLISTRDGGYLKNCWPFLVKLDSSLSIQWTQTLNGGVGSIHELEGGGYLASGYGYVSESLDAIPWVYLVRTDSAGNFSKTEIKEPTPPRESLFAIYPNPTQGVFAVKSSVSNYQICIYTMEGKLVYKASKVAGFVDITGLSSGLYLVQLIDAQGQVVAAQKLSKQ